MSAIEHSSLQVELFHQFRSLGGAVAAALIAVCITVVRLRPLPPDITENDTVYGPGNERAIYTHSEQSIPLASVAHVQSAPMNPIPLVVPSG